MRIDTQHHSPKGEFSYEAFGKQSLHGFHSASAEISTTISGFPIVAGKLCALSRRDQ
jgi:hypothetical protein